ncbi:nuclear transport factor 2 family protein [Streptomyces sp. NPDC007076]|uniref:nuclear transport factor 2 family protein n=1 Tax=unclassified Streptomyces TaxID=2593676 RepID=UPI002E791CDE|nr:nuclear transport factor 2 family protein [Streptomyces sp. JV190]MEE1840028.1 nuclear transport factor 2 family protein [Streptomyces sp. JV190]
MTTEMLSRTEAGTVFEAPAGVLAEAEFGTLYPQIQQFYAHQMQLFDSHEAERWAGTFTEDAVFDVPTLDEPVRGRTALASNVRRNEAQQARSGERFRHWIGMLDLRPRGDGTLHTRCYALVYVTPGQGRSAVHRVCVMEDVLVRSRGKWRVRHRVVTRDDLG